LEKNNKLSTVSEAFFRYLKRTESFSKNTFLAYKNDIKNFILFLKNHKIENLEDLDGNLIIEYFQNFKTKYKGSTLGRNKSAIKKLLNYLRTCFKINLTESLSEIKIKKYETKYKSVAVSVIFRVIESIKGKDFFSKRDKAMFLILYTTGIKASELKDLKMKDLNLSNKFLEVRGKFNRRLPFGEYVAEGITTYLIEREKIMKMRNKSNRGYLFVERNGDGLTRQSVYLIVRKRSNNAGLGVNISPRVLRNSIFIHLLSSGAKKEDVKEMLGNKILLPHFEKIADQNKVDSVYIYSHPILLDK